ncbi:ral guanine nucleotide dissociation stimulator-like [Ovis aries]|uniref:ral guanine nucleotide dissociation stimulator-like n=1 Tax=Ovis aries TaxID=9940 RepID=UPI001C2E4243|nr:ral guanine nucleotide dissociation stimulator-like [Ovis aries]
MQQTAVLPPGLQYSRVGVVGGGEPCHTSCHIQACLQYCPCDASCRYGCILPYCDEDGGPLHQLKMAMTSILGTWLHLYPEDFQQSPEYPCLKMLLAYVELNMPDSDLEQRARHLLAQLETLKSTEAEGNAPPGEEALETSPDLTPSPPLSNPATAPQSRQAQSPAPIQVQDLHQVSMPAPNPEPQHAHALALT